MERISQDEYKKRYGSIGLSAFTLPQPEKPLVDKVTDAIGLHGAVDTFGSVLARQGVGNQVSNEETRKYVEQPTAGQIGGALLQTGALAASTAITGGASLPGQIAAGAGLGYLYDVGSDLTDKKSMKDVLTPGWATAVGALVPPVLKGAGALVGGAIRGSKGLIDSAGTKIANTVSDAAPSGVKQFGTEMIDRIPRAIDKGKTAIQDAGARAEKIRNAPPVVQNAIKSGLDNVITDAVTNADTPTKEAYKKMVQIAESPRTGLRPAVRPESVAGDSIAEQYKILNTKRKDIGSQIGDAVDKLSTKGTVDVLPAQRGMRELLFKNGIKPDISGQLIFDGSSLTPKQQGLMQQLYELSTKNEQMTPRQVYNLDKLFSQLQREARFDGLDNLYLSTPDGDINAFRAFKNIFSNQLDQIAPEIAPLNKQYAQLRNLQDDIEGSIVKRGNYESTRNVDPAEFAQTNLRRAFSDAQSAADYRELSDKLDAFARANGYTGANALDLAGFAQRLRTLYPDAVPETSAQGLFGGGIKGAIEKVMKAGAPDVTDQQNALKELLGVPKQQSSVPGKSLSGGIAGVGQDENGKPTFDPATAALGMAGMSMGSGKKTALKELISYKKANLYLIKQEMVTLGKKVNKNMVKMLENELRALAKEYNKLVK